VYVCVCVCVCLRKREREREKERRGWKREWTSENSSSALTQDEDWASERERLWRTKRKRKTKIESWWKIDRDKVKYKDEEW
jgi:hypothetical protein